MKKFLFCVLALVVAVAASGCVRMHSVTDIAADGSGTATLEFSLSESVAAALQEMEELDPGAGSGGDMEMPSLSEIKKERIEQAIEPYDVKLTSFSHDTAEGRESIKMAFAFKDLKGLSAAMGAAMGEQPEDGLGIYEAGDGNYVLKKASYDFSDFPEFDDEEDAAEDEAEEPAEQTPEQMQKQMEIMGKLMGAMSELDVSLKITVPGEIVETNAPQQEGRTSIWTINSSNMMTAGPDMEPHIVFSGKGLKIKSALKETE